MFDAAKLRCIFFPGVLQSLKNRSEYNHLAVLSQWPSLIQRNWLWRICCFPVMLWVHICAPSCIQFIKFPLMNIVLSTSLQSLQPTGHNLAPTHKSSSAYIRHKMYFLCHSCTLRYQSQKSLCRLCVFYSRFSTMKTRLGCLSNKSDSYSDFSEFLPPAHETAARCLKWVCQKISEVSNKWKRFCCVTELSGCHSLPWVWICYTSSKTFLQIKFIAFFSVAFNLI